MDNYIVVLDDGETFSGDGEVWVVDHDDDAINIKNIDPLKVYRISDLIAGYHAALDAGLFSES